VQERGKLRLHVVEDGERFEGDPIYFIGADSVVLAKGAGRVTVPTHEVTRVDVRKFNLLATGGLIAIGIVGGLFVAAAIQCSDPEAFC
jgi:hypothetical protein